MSFGLLALLDDVAALVKVSAATLDDIPAQVAKTSGKVSGTRLASGAKAVSTWLNGPGRQTDAVATLPMTQRPEHPP